MKDDFSAVWPDTVFEEVDALPDPQHEASTDERNGELHLGECGPQVGGHVVCALGVVMVGEVFRRDSVEVGFEVGAHGGVGVLLDKQGGGGVATKNGQ